MATRKRKVLSNTYGKELHPIVFSVDLAHQFTDKNPKFNQQAFDAATLYDVGWLLIHNIHQNLTEAEEGIA